jgi:hypothetical protein
LDSYAYRRAVAEVLTEAADRRVIEPEVRIKPGTLARDIHDFGQALYLVDRLIENDSDPRWWTLEPLQPALGRCIYWLRQMQHVEHHVARGEELLSALQADLQNRVNYFSRLAGEPPGRTGYPTSDQTVHR